VTAQRVIGTPALPPSVRVGQRLSLAMSAGTSGDSVAAKPGGSYDVDVAVIGGGPAGLSMVSRLSVMFWSRCQDRF
jgi:NADPH-dependent 2,4-dienoyl-CoA reductase/sulfur reductase-like enzyme